MAELPLTLWWTRILHGFRSSWCVCGYGSLVRLFLHMGTTCMFGDHLSLQWVAAMLPFVKEYDDRLGEPGHQCSGAIPELRWYIIDIFLYLFFRTIVLYHHHYYSGYCHCYDYSFNLHRFGRFDFVDNPLSLKCLVSGIQIQQLDHGVWSSTFDHVTCEAPGNLKTHLKQLFFDFLFASCIALYSFCAAWDG